MGDAPSKARVYHALGLDEQRAARFDEAERWFEMALAIDERLGDEIGKGQRQEGLAGIACARRRWHVAESLYRAALEVLEKMGDQRDLARVCYRLGVVTQELGRRDEAAQWYQRSLKLAKAAGDAGGADFAFWALRFMDLRRKMELDALLRRDPLEAGSSTDASPPRK